MVIKLLYNVQQLEKVRNNGVTIVSNVGMHQNF